MISTVNRYLKVFCEGESKAKNPTVIYVGEPFPSVGDVRYIRYNQIIELM